MVPKAKAGMRLNRDGTPELRGTWWGPSRDLGTEGEPGDEASPTLCPLETRAPLPPPPAPETHAEPRPREKSNSGLSAD